MLGRFALAHSVWKAWGEPISLCSPQRLARGKIFLLDGIGGTRIVPLTIGRGLVAAGLPHALEEFEWGHGFGLATFLLHDLRRLERNREQGRRLAGRIREYRAEHPGRPVHVIAVSGGAGPGVFALEDLNGDESITSAVLVSPALSPGYDLTNALSRTTAGIVSVCSWLDFVILGLGTQIFGTVDRRFTPAAGLVGFREPDGNPAARLAYRRLRQVHWRPEMMSRRWFGDHFSSSTTEFARSGPAVWIADAEGLELP